jgi:nitrile hydratase subunit beta
MNGAQDLGGQMGFGPVAPEQDEPVFHADWEKRALGLVLTAGAMGHWNIDEGRHARESLNPADYYTSSYYQIWIKGLEKQLIDHGFVTADELAAGRALVEGTRPKRVLRGADAMATLARGAAYDRAVATPARFRVGEHVRARNFHPAGHTRLPRYARGKLGRIDAVRGGFVLPDTNAHARGENPEWLYTVVFDAAEIWGESADPTQTISIDAWESYLEPA